LHKPKLVNVVLAHDGRFLRATDGCVFSARGGWPWERYLEFADSLTFCARIEDLGGDSPEGLWDITEDGVDFVPIPSLSGPLLRFTNRRDARSRLEHAIAAADALVVRLPSEIGMLAARLAHRMGKPYAVEVVTCTWDALRHRGGLQGKLYAPVSWLEIRRTVRRAPFVLYVTREFLQRRYPTRGRAVACSDVELPSPADRVLQARLAEIRSGRSPFDVGTIAVLTVRFKGVQTALEALESVRSSLPGLELQVVGAGDPAPWRKLAARHGVGDHVSFVGVLGGDEIPQWLDRVDLYIQPSFQEGLPRALLEAMSRGCPALGSTAGGIPELLPPECLHRPGDAKRLAGLIVRAASDVTWLERQARRNFETAKAYAPERLNPVRREFWQDFVSFAGTR
jgi:glycosyltransferase involved in cell wall biosynthesis